MRGPLTLIISGLLLIGLSACNPSEMPPNPPTPITTPAPAPTPGR